MAYTTQYIGSRYVPTFADPAEWDSTRTYEPLTIVLNEGNSYTSRQFVPVGVQITNTDYWLETGNYNAQVEQYRQEVLQIENSMQIYANVEAMKAANVKSGSIIGTAGFYNANDGGAASYIVNSTDTPNGYDIIQLNNNLIASLIIPDELNIKMVGAKTGINTDSAPMINRAFEISNNVVIPTGGFYIGNTININNQRFTLKGSNTQCMIAPNNNFPAENYLISVNAINSEFVIANFQLYARDMNVKGLNLFMPYDACKVDTILGVNFTNTFINAGNTTQSDISQSLVIQNCQVYGPTNTLLNFPLFNYTRVQELIMRDCKTLIRNSGLSQVPCLYLTNTNNALFEGNSFSGVEKGSVIYVTGAASYNNRFIGNYFENNTCDYAATVDLTGIATRSLTVFAFNTYYYNATTKYNFINAVNCMLIGEDEIPTQTNTRVVVISSYINKFFTNPSGTSFLGFDGNTLNVGEVSLNNNVEGVKGYTIFRNASSTADYGVRINIPNGKYYSLAYDGFAAPEFLEVSEAGGALHLKAPDGTTKYIRVNNDGELVVTNS